MFSNIKKDIFNILKILYIYCLLYEASALCRSIFKTNYADRIAEEVNINSSSNGGKVNIWASELDYGWLQCVHV